MSQAQREYLSNMSAIENASFGSSLRSAGENHEIVQAIRKRSIMERCCGMKIGPVVMSDVGKIVTLFVFLIAIGIAAFGVS